MLKEAKTEKQEVKIKPLLKMDDVYRDLVEATSDSIYLVDSECRYLYVNPKHCLRIGLKAAELYGRNYSEFHSPEETAAFTADVEKTFQTGESFQREYFSHRDGGEFVRTFSPVRAFLGKGEILGVSVISKNITQLKLAESLHAALAEKSPIGIFIIQKDRFQWVNRRYQTNTGYTADEIIGLESLFMVHPDDREHVRKSALAMIRGEASFPYEYRIITKKGDISWYMGTVTSSEYKGRRAILGCQMDISLQKQAEDALKQSEERSRTIIDTIADAYYETDLAGNTLMFNEPLLQLMGYSHEEMKQADYRKHVDKKNKDIAYRVFNQVFRTGRPVKKMEWEVISRQGEKRNVDLSVALVRDAQGKPIGYRGIVTDTTARIKAEEVIRKQAYHDSLTGLPNRVLFYDRLNMAIKRAQRDKKMIAVIILDLDHFKEVNDNWGHATGDHLLKAIAARLIKQVRDTDTVARYGGDEFTMILPMMTCKEDAVRIARKIIGSFKEPFALDACVLDISASLGIAFYPKHSDDIDTLMKKADVAMYRAKALGGKRSCFYTNLK